MLRIFAALATVSLATATIAPAASARTVIIEHGRGFHHHHHFRHHRFHHHDRTVIIKHR